jgi:hypothetical protein
VRTGSKVTGLGLTTELLARAKEEAALAGLTEGSSGDKVMLKTFPFQIIHFI